VDGVLQIGNVFVGRMNLASRLAKILNKFIFGEWHMSDTHQVVWFLLSKVDILFL
jgi:hypothetical protein